MTGVFFLLAALALYFLPSISATSRKHPDAGAIFVLNFFLGWTFFGWVIALIWAVKKPRV